MAVLNDPVATEYENIEPNLSFRKTWNIQNNGNESWPAGCYLKCAGGHMLGAYDQCVVPILQPGESRHITVDMISPPHPGVYQSKWRLCTPGGSFFGDVMWAIITVVEEGTMDLTQRLSHFSELGAFHPTNIATNPFRPK